MKVSPENKRVESWIKRHTSQSQGGLYFICAYMPEDLFITWFDAKVNAGSDGELLMMLRQGLKREVSLS